MSSASAAPAAEPCIPGPVEGGGDTWVCLYDNADFTGQFWSAPGSVFWLAPQYDNRASAVINASKYDLWLYKDGFDRGDHVVLAPGERWVAPADWDNQLTSMFVNK
ncbi:peptidase inhibitor family I36 protein [Amycolatopsis sp. lyj-23]|uniref:peptidase inhibitor family I36 protein n=1 Tax=Amycolatopsis sp. lyj-23 TaxID=2789283 RepID=UPI00397BD29E